MNEVAAALMLLTELSKSYQQMYALARTAKKEGRDISPDELLRIDEAYGASFDNLDDAIADAEKEEA